MANNRLQLRRGTAAEFAGSGLTTRNGEAILDTDSGRIRIDNQGGGGHLHQVQAPLVQTEGHPFHLLWNVQGYNNEEYLTVPATRRGELSVRSSGTAIGADYVGDAQIPVDSPLTQASIYACTASLPDLALQDACTVHVSANGDFEAGSSSPAMAFAFQLGTDDDAAGQTRFSPKRESSWLSHGLDSDGTSILPATISTGPVDTRLPGIYISNDTHGPNVLQYDGPFQWELDAKVEFLGHRGGGAFPSAGSGTSTVRVTGKLRWGLLSQHNSLSYQGKTISGFKNAYAVGSTMSLTGESGNWYPYGWVHGTGPHAYQAVGPIEVGSSSGVFNTASAVTTGDLMAKYNTLVSRLNTWFQTAPGVGSKWQEYWRMVVNEEHFCFEEEVELKNDNLCLSLMVGGPMQDDLNFLPPRWTATPAGLSSILGGGHYSIGATAGAGHRQATIVRPETDAEGEACYASRFPSNASSSYTPVDDPNDYGPWRRHWYKLADDRADKMRVYSSTAYMVGGRNGVSDFNPY